MRTFQAGVILDEVQRCPRLFEWLQGIVDDRRDPGRFVLTGSQQFGLLSGITQSLAGRVALVSLLPFAASELRAANLLPPTIDEAMFRGGYPPLFETWVMGEFLKRRWNAGRPSNLFFWRDRSGHEVDLLVESPEGIQAVEIKATATPTADALRGLGLWQALAGASGPRPCLVYGGDAPQRRSDFDILPWRML